MDAKKVQQKSVSHETKIWHVQKFCSHNKRHNLTIRGPAELPRTANKGITVADIAVLELFLEHYNYRSSTVVNILKGFNIF